jgi:hypothetical protein
VLTAHAAAAHASASQLGTGPRVWPLPPLQVLLLVLSCRPCRRRCYDRCRICRRCGAATTTAAACDLLRPCRRSKAPKKAPRDPVRAGRWQHSVQPQSTGGAHLSPRLTSDISNPAPVPLPKIITPRPWGASCRPSPSYLRAAVRQGQRLTGAPAALAVLRRMHCDGWCCSSGRGWPAAACQGQP